MGTLIPEGFGYVAGRSRDTARKLLKIAADQHLRGRVVQAVSDGYLVPLSVLDVYQPGSRSAGPGESEEPAPQEQPAEAATPSSSWTKAEIKAWADEHGVVLNDLRTKAEYLAAIEEAS